jgi:2-polyprenyl-3-methyl-5-hydroxy-6-metoxy-1,4-benzoquinol methylase
MVGVDAAEKAIQQANANKQERPITFAIGDARHLSYPDDAFDLVLIQSILHHDDKPFNTIREAFRLAPEILIHEPNGNNMGLKVIERTSVYHREHSEKSYSSRQIRRWITQAGGEIVAEKFAGFVPMFCPDWLARSMKRIEPIVEQAPLIRALTCAVYVVVAVRNDRSGQIRAKLGTIDVGASEACPKGSR